MRTILFDRKDAIIRPLRELIEKQDHRTLILWAIDCGTEVAKLFAERFPDDTCLQQALKATQEWAQGRIKMPEARPCALAAHQAAKDHAEDKVAVALCHAIGHVVGTVHVETHAMGLVIYGLTAYWHLGGDILVKDRLAWFCERLVFWEKNGDLGHRAWAGFLERTRPNKEWLLHQKEHES